MDKLGDTPLHVACRSGNDGLSVARTLAAAAESFGPSMHSSLVGLHGPRNGGAGLRRQELLGHSVRAQKWVFMARNAEGDTILDEVREHLARILTGIVF